MSNVVNRYFVCDDLFFSDIRLCKTKENVIVMYTNAQSCANMKTLDEIKLFVANCDCVIDVIIIAETWYKKNETQIYEIAGYNAIHSCRATRAGGVSVYIKSNISIDNYEIIESDINAVSVEVSNLKGIKKLRFIGVYRRPFRGNYGAMLKAIDSLLVD